MGTRATAARADYTRQKHVLVAANGRLSSKAMDVKATSTALMLVLAMGR